MHHAHSMAWAAVGALLTLAFAASAQVPGPPDEMGSRNMVLHFQIIEADGFDSIDPQIAEIVDELQALFRFEGYRLLDTPRVTGVLSEDVNVVRVQTDDESLGALEIEAFIEGHPDPSRALVHVNVSHREVGAPQYEDVMEASVIIRDGQTVILGSGRPSASAGALILVMSAEIED